MHRGTKAVPRLWPIWEISGYFWIMKEQDELDRRKHARTDLTSCATIQVRNSNDEAHGIVTDVSSAGLALETDHPPSVGESVSVWATLDGHDHSVEARVARVDKVGGNVYVVGLEYDMETMKQDPFLQEVLRHYRA